MKPKKHDTNKKASIFNVNQQCFYLKGGKYPLTATNERKRGNSTESMELLLKKKGCR